MISNLLCLFKQIPVKVEVGHTETLDEVGRELRSTHHINVSWLSQILTVVFLLNLLFQIFFFSDQFVLYFVSFDHLFVQVVDLFLKGRFAPLVVVHVPVQSYQLSLQMMLLEHKSYNDYYEKHGENDRGREEEASDASHQLVQMLFVHVSLENALNAVEGTVALILVLDQLLLPFDLLVIVLQVFFLFVFLVSHTEVPFLEFTQKGGVLTWVEGHWSLLLI